MRLRTISRAFLVTTVVLGASASLATTADAQGRLRGIVRLGGDVGGDELLEFEYEDGSTPDVTAGGGLLLTVGGVLEAWRSGGHGLDAQVNAGIKYRTIPAATNQDLNWLRLPVEGLLYYRAPSGFRFGGGPVVHLANALRASGEAADGTLEFETTPGAIIQAELIRGNVVFDLRYTALKYKVSGSGETVNASSFGGGIGMLFGRK